MTRVCLVTPAPQDLPAPPETLDLLVYQACLDPRDTADTLVDLESRGSQDVLERRGRLGQLVLWVTVAPLVLVVLMEREVEMDLLATLEFPGTTGCQDLTGPQDPSDPRDLQASLVPLVPREIGVRQEGLATRVEQAQQELMVCPEPPALWVNPACVVKTALLDLKETLVPQDRWVPLDSQDL